MNETHNQPATPDLPPGGRLLRGGTVGPRRSRPGWRDHFDRHGVRSANEASPVDMAGQLRDHQANGQGTRQTKGRGSIGDVLTDLRVAGRRLACANLRAAWAIERMEREIYKI